MTISWHFLMNLFSALTIVWRNLRYWTLRPCVSMQWTKCWTTRSLISLHNWKLFINMCCIVMASRIWKKEMRTRTELLRLRSKKLLQIGILWCGMPEHLAGRLTPGLRKRLMCLCSRAWFCWFPAQKFCRNWWANFMISCIRKSSPWKRNTADRRVSTFTHKDARQWTTFF